MAICQVQPYIPSFGPPDYASASLKQSQMYASFSLVPSPVQRMNMSNFEISPLNYNNNQLRFKLTSRGDI